MRVETQLFVLFELSNFVSGYWWTQIAQLGAHVNSNALDADVELLDADSDLDHDLHLDNYDGSFLSPRPICGRLHGLSPGQARICELFWDHMPAVGAGARHAIEECQWQFKHGRWNCSTPYARNSTPHQLTLVSAATREQAFTYALIAAGVTHEVSRSCKRGMLASCGCSDAKRPQELESSWQWGGCGDNIDYGYRFAKDFVDIREKEWNYQIGSKHYGQSLMNRWNNEVGRKLLKKRSKPHCKCHGVSGACSVRTCWMQLPDVRKVSNALLNKYRAARRVRVNSRGNLQVVLPEQQLSLENESHEDHDQDHNPIDDGDVSNEVSTRLSRHRRAQTRNRRRRRNGHRTTVRPLDLVYLDQSPDYCNQNSLLGTVGTKGRVCDKYSRGADSCKLLCCGRGYDTYKEEVTKKCNCRFQWCCKVVCDMCTQVTSTHVCK